MANRGGGQAESSRPRRGALSRRGRDNRDNRVRGPTSALTDFLASNNISAAEIRRNYLQRVAERADEPGEGPSIPASDQAPADPNAAGDGDDGDDDDDLGVGSSSAAASSRPTARSRGKEPAGRVMPDDDEESSQAGPSTARRREPLDRQLKGKGKEPAITNGKAKGKGKGKKGTPDESSSSSESEQDFGFGKVKKLPGQRHVCEACKKKFTVTPYTIQAPKGGLLCTTCGKTQKKTDATSKKTTAPKTAVPRRRRQNFESAKLDGATGYGVKSLQKMCLELLVQHACDIEDFGDLTEAVWQSLSHIFTKNRSLRSDTIDLFLKPDLERLEFQDCAYLETTDFQKIIQTCVNIQELILVNAGQFKDENLDLLGEKAEKLTFVHFYATNLVSADAWKRFFVARGAQLEAIRLKWLDSTFDDSVLETLVAHCPGLKRLKLSMCSSVSIDGLAKLIRLTKLEHLSLELPELADALSNSASLAVKESVPYDFWTRADTYPGRLQDAVALFDHNTFPWDIINPDLTTDAQFDEFRRKAEANDLARMMEKQRILNDMLGFGGQGPFFDDGLSVGSDGGSDMELDRPDGIINFPAMMDRLMQAEMDTDEEEQDEPARRGVGLEPGSDNTAGNDRTTTPDDDEQESPVDVFSRVITKLGPNLRTLSLKETPLVVGNMLLDVISVSCPNLSKIRITEADEIADDNISQVFDPSLIIKRNTDSDGNRLADAIYPDEFLDLARRAQAPRLQFVDFSGCRDWEPEEGRLESESEWVPDAMLERQSGEPIWGFGPASLVALMNRSGKSIQHLNVSSCNTVLLSAFKAVFPTRDQCPDAEAIESNKAGLVYPALESVDLSFCPPVNADVIQSVIYSCPRLKKVVAIACFAAWNPAVNGPVPTDGRAVKPGQVEIYKPGTICVPRTCALIGPQDYTILDDRVAAVVKGDADVVTAQRQSKGKEVVIDLDEMVDV